MRRPEVSSAPTQSLGHSTGDAVLMQVSERFVASDLWLMLGFTLAALYMMRTAFQLSRVEGGLMLAAYTGYLWLLSGPVWLFF